MRACVQAEAARRNQMTLTRSILTIALVVVVQQGLMQPVRAQPAPCRARSHPGEPQHRQDARRHQGRRRPGLCRTEAHHRNSGAALQGEGPRRILSEADAGARLQGRIDRRRRQRDRAAQGQRRRPAQARGVGASRHGVSRRHRRHGKGKGRRHRRARASATIRAASRRCCR